jgi:dihydrofolate reductase
MGKVLFGLSVSLDGFIADKQGDPSLLFAWMGRTMEQLHEVVGDTLSETGAVIMGHRTFDQIDSEQGWVFPDGTAPGCLAIAGAGTRQKGQDALLL